MDTWTLTVSSWGVRESCEFGRETKKWELRREGLSVGRSNDCDVQLQVGREGGRGGRGEGGRGRALDGVERAGF